MEGFSSVGRVSKLFGAGGELYVNIYTTFPDDFNREEPLFVKVNELMVPLFLSKFGRRGQKGAVLAFDDIDNPVRAGEFIGVEFYVTTRAGENEEDEQSLSNLIGFKAKINGKFDGVIEDFIDNQLNPLFKLLVDGREVFVPVNEDFISELDIDANLICFELPEGLLELYME